MTKTSAKIALTFGEGEAIKADGVPSSDDTHPRADITDLATGSADKKLLYATFEPNGWYLDGNTKLAPEQAHIGFVSEGISDANGEFALPVILEIELGADYTIEQGIRLEFSEISGDYCTELIVKYYDVADTLLHNQVHTPTGYKYFAELSTKPVEDVRSIQVHFYATNKPYRHLRLLDIQYDQVLFGSSEIASASLIEHINPISVELPANSLEFSLHSDDGDFSIVDPQGIYAHLERHQKIDVYELVDDAANYMGRFYLEEWSSENDRLAHFDAIDALQILGTIPFAYAGNFFRDGDTYTVSQLVADIFENTGFDYEIDASLASQYVHGWIPLGQSCRDVLQNLAFAHGGFVDCARSNKVQIKAMRLVEDLATFDYLLTNSNIAGRNIRQLPLVTGIRLTAHYWQTVNEASFEYQIYDGNIEVGTYRFLLPGDILMFGSSSTGTATKTLGGARYQYHDVEITGAGTLSLYMLNAKKHIREKHEQAVSGLPANTPENILEIDNAYFVTPDNVEGIMQRLVDYYAQKFELEGKAFASLVSVGDSAISQTQKADKYHAGIVERAEIDLTGGFKTKLKSIGNIQTVFTSGNKYDAGQVSHAGFTFTGTWSYALAASAYGGSVKFVATGQSGYVEFAFVGSQFKMIFSQLLDRGAVDVFVDGVLIATVSENGAETWQQEWTSPEFTDGYHTVKLAHVETGGGAVTDLDAVEIVG